MRETISRTDAIKLISQAREALCDAQALQDLMDDYHASTVHEALLSAYGGVTNGYLSQVYEAISGRVIEVIGKTEDRFPCPCCGRRTLTELYDTQAGTGYDICDHCRWEDDGTSDPERHSSVNRGSMTEYRTRLGKESNYYFSEKWAK